MWVKTEFTKYRISWGWLNQLGFYLCWALKKLFQIISSKWDVNHYSSISYKGLHKKLCSDVLKRKPGNKTKQNKTKQNKTKQNANWQKPLQTDLFVSHASIPCSVKNWLDNSKGPRGHSRIQSFKEIFSLILSFPFFPYTKTCNTISVVMVPSIPECH